MNRSMLGGTLSLALAIAGCSSSTTSPAQDAGGGQTGHDAGMQEDAGTQEDSGTTPQVDAGSEAATSKPATPQMLGVEPLGGGLHVTWKLNDTGLTGVELWRKKDTGTYSKAYTLPGVANAQHDSAATAPGMYCYQVMTIRGTEMSDMSPEKCGTP